MLRPLKRLARQSIRRFGWDVRRVEQFGEPNLADFLRFQAIDLVIDVGANEGQFAIDLREAGYAGEIVSFEPIASVFAKLAANCARDRHWTARHLALGDRVGTGKLAVTAHTVFSSMKPQAKRLRDWHPGTAVIGSETVDIATLDQIFPHFAGCKVLLKIDTQGFEQQVLAGATASLPKIAAVQLELPVVHFYENVWSFADAIAFMERAGFAIAQLRPVVYLPGTGSLGEIDCVFRRA